MRKTISVCLILFLSLTLFTGCQEKEMKSVYSLREIYSSGDYGFFIKDGDSFYPVKDIERSGDENFEWTVGDFDCPRVTAKTPLVAVFDTNAEMPENYYIDNFKSLGYSIGANVSIGEDENSMWINTTNTCPGSDVEASFASQDFDEDVEIKSINGERPFSNIDTDINVLIGLQKNKYYDLSVYVGTQNIEGSICADTMILKKTGHIDLEMPLVKTDKQYFVVNLPQNINPGYYDINGEGFFQI